MINYLFIRTTSLLAVIFMALQSKAEGKPVMSTLVHQSVRMITDTVPAVKKTAEEKPPEEKPATTSLPVIKEVPKARKQIKPVVVPSVPVKVKIIKPVIKRVGSLIP